MFKLYYSFLLLALVGNCSLLAQNDLPANAQPGKCYAQCMIPDQYETVTERVLLKEASSRIEVIPAVYDTIEEEILEKEAYKVLTLQPAVFTTASQALLVKEASSRLSVVRYE